MDGRDLVDPFLQFSVNIVVPGREIADIGVNREPR